MQGLGALTGASLVSTYAFVVQNALILMRRAGVNAKCCEQNKSAMRGLRTGRLETWATVRETGPYLQLRAELTIDGATLIGWSRIQGQHHSCLRISHHTYFLVIRIVAFIVLGTCQFDIIKQSMALEGKSTSK